MNKPNSLRDYLINSIEYLKMNPDKLSMHIENGRYRSTMTSGLSMLAVYPVKIIIQDFAGDANTVAFVLYQWIRNHQSELMTNLETNKEAVKFEADIIDNTKADLLFEIELSERIIIKKDESGAFNFTYPPEPQYEPGFAAQPYELLGENGEVLASWTSTDGSSALYVPMPFTGP